MGKLTKSSFSGNSHSVSECAMMWRRVSRVVDEEGKPYEMKNLRVADVSVFLTQDSGILGASVYAVAGKITDAILSKGAEQYTYKPFLAIRRRYYTEVQYRERKEYNSGFTSNHDIIQELSARTFCECFRTVEMRSMHVISACT